MVYKWFGKGGGGGKTIVLTNFEISTIIKVSKCSFFTFKIFNQY